MSKLFTSFVADESGAGAVEYSLVLLLALAIVTMVSTSMKSQVSSMLVNIGSKLNAGLNNIS
jgi:Flp pilus assembly pilin Flp